MTLECMDPDDLPIPEMYTQVVIATGSKLVFVSGQQPEDIHGFFVGHGNFAAQARVAFGNLGRALAAAGARPEQVCKITIYVVDYKRDEHVPIIEEAQIALFGDHKPSKRSGRDSDDVPRLPDRGRCDRGHRPHHRELHKDAVDKSLMELQATQWMHERFSDTKVVVAGAETNRGQSQCAL